MTGQAPVLIALCGLPGSGKSQIQEFLHEDLGIETFDDGGVIRRHCMELFGMSWEDCYTQEGKKRFTMIEGKPYENRKILGDYGFILEGQYGPNVIPNWALRTAFSIAETRRVAGFSFGSVRRSQAEVYREAGGLVVEVVRPGVEPTGNVWDLYDKSLVTHTFRNDKPGLKALRSSVKRFFEPLLNNQSAAAA